MPMWPLIPVVILLGTMLSSCGSENGKEDLVGWSNIQMTYLSFFLEKSALTVFD